MLNLNQSATLPSAVASHHQCKESIFNISNRAPPIVPDTAPRDRRDELHAVMGRIGCGQVLLRRGRVIEVSATGRGILERECRFSTGPETLYSAVRQLVNRAGAQIPAGSTSWLATSSREGIASLDRSDDECLVRTKPAPSSCSISMLVQSPPRGRCSACLASQPPKPSLRWNWHAVAICLI